ncbi:hypothetical protein PISL3812_05088 [Talaromyces islandicus]|uniref:Uncharacterized protein n=1 Tax=Talaromyces islandicus TaxID=28573 RepID=A0A0U1LY54_TALIS|nr:hypothetical protein PISL3812_05088 [Talaromyces islandicus]
MSSIMRLLGDRVPDQSEDVPYTNEDRLVYYIPPKNTVGLQIFVKVLPYDSVMRRATAGGILQIGGRFFFLTVSHIFEQHEEKEALQNGELHCRESIEEEEEGESDKNDDSTVNINRTSTPNSSGSEATEASGSPSEESCQGINFDSEALYERLLAQDQHLLPPTVSCSSLLGLTKLGHPDSIGSKTLDYTLIEIHDTTLIKANMFSGPRVALGNIQVDKIAHIGNEDHDVVVLTAHSGDLKGTLFATPRFIRFAQAAATQKTFFLKLDGHVRSGDCGSWVVDATSGHLYGHIFGGGNGTRTAYIIPADEIFDDIQKKCGQPAIFPSTINEFTRNDLQIHMDEFHSESQSAVYPESLGMLQIEHTKEIPALSRTNTCHSNSKTDVSENVRDRGISAHRNTKSGDKLPQESLIVERNMETSVSNEKLEKSKCFMVSESHEPAIGIRVQSESLEDSKAQISNFSGVCHSTHSQVNSKETKISSWNAPKSKPSIFYHAPRTLVDRVSKHGDQAIVSDECEF